jgi:hypothetical protein
MDPAEVAARVIDAIRSSTFYVVPHAAEYGDSLRRRVDALLGGGAPSRVAVEEIFGLRG